ncbi:hypothetical protein [Nostoc sp.]
MRIVSAVRDRYSSALSQLAEVIDSFIEKLDAIAMREPKQPVTM